MDNIPKKYVKKILIVDDEAELRATLRQWLEQAKYYILEAADGRQALNVIRNERPHLVLLDVKMPEMDGWEVLQAIRADDEMSSLPVIMLTAYGETDSLLESQRMHANDFFIKPFKLEELLIFIKRYL